MEVFWKQELPPICKIENGSYDSTSFNSNEAVSYLDLDSLKQSEQREPSSWNHDTDQEMTKWNNFQQENYYNFSSGCEQDPLQPTENFWNWPHNGGGDGHVPPTLELDMVSNNIQSCSDNSSYGVPQQSSVMSDRESNMQTCQTENSVVNIEKNDIPVVRSTSGDECHKDILTTPQHQSNAGYNYVFNREFLNQAFCFESGMPVNQTENGASIKDKNASESKGGHMVQYMAGKEGKTSGEAGDDIIILKHVVGKQGPKPLCPRNKINRNSPLKFRISRSHHGILTLTNCGQETATTNGHSSNDTKLEENSSLRTLPYIVNKTFNEGHPGEEIDIKGNVGKGIQQVINQPPNTHVKFTNKETPTLQSDNKKNVLSTIVKGKDTSILYNKDINGPHLQDIKSVSVSKETKCTNELKQPAIRFSGIQRIESFKQSVANKCQNGSSYKCIKILSKDRVVTQKEQQAQVQLEYKSKSLLYDNKSRPIIQYISHQASPTIQRPEDKKLVHKHNFKSSLFHNVKIVSKDGHSIAHCEPTVLTPTKYIAKLKRENELKMFPMNGSTTAYFGVNKQRCSEKTVNENEPKILNEEISSICNLRDATMNDNSKETMVPKEEPIKETVNRYSVDNKTIARALHCEEFIKNQGRPYHGNDMDAITALPEMTNESDSQIITVTLMETNSVKVNKLINKYPSSTSPQCKENEVQKLSGIKTPLRIIIKKRQEDKELLKNSIPIFASHINSKISQEKCTNSGPFVGTKEVPKSKVSVQSECIEESEQIQQSKSFVGSRKKLMFRCYRCGQRQATRNSLITHIKSHQQPYCKLCFMIVSTIQQLQSHMLKGHPVKSELMYQHNLHFVTSKYGRRRPVLSTSSLKISRRRKDDIKAICESKIILENASTIKEMNKKRKLERNKLNKIKI